MHLFESLITFATMIKNDYIAAAITSAAILILLLFEGCASIGNPSGGPRDERPPRFVSATPPPGSVNIPLNAERFVLNFDEIVEVKDVLAKVIISPPSKNIPRVTTLGKRVLITFQDSLQPNTTYTVDFSNAIQDLNEGNQLSNFSYSFSTGPYIDSLRVAGRVLSAQDMEPLQFKLVGLFRLPDGDEEAVESVDSIFEHPLNFNQSIHKKLFTQKFDRVARTDDRGQFSVEGLAPGRYRVYALDDVNSDYIFSNADEEVAFLDVDVSPSTSQAIASDSIFNMKTGTLDTIIERRRTIYLPNDVILRSAKSARAQQFIEKYERVDSTRINLLFHIPNKELPKISIVGMPEGSDPFLTERSLTSDTLSLWLKSPALVSSDTLRVAIAYQTLDSVQQYSLKSDTLRLVTDRLAIKRAQDQENKLLEKQAKRLAKEAKKKNEEEADAITDSIPPAAPKPLIKLDFHNATGLRVDRPVIFETSVPVSRMDLSGFRFEEKVDTVWKDIPLPPLQQDSLNPRRYLLGEKWKPATDYRLTIDSLAISGMYGLDNGKIEQTIRTIDDKQLTSLRLNITDWPAGRPAYAELLNSSDKHVAIQPLADNSVFFPYLSAGKYYVRIIDDRNHNLRWDSGDPVVNLQPEEAFYYPKPITLKAAWGKEESWTIFSTPIDKMKPESILKNKPTGPKVRGNKSQTTKPDEEEDDEDY